MSNFEIWTIGLILGLILSQIASDVRIGRQINELNKCGIEDMRK